MSNILLIETATRVCSVGLTTNGTITAIRESFEQRSHAELITIFIDEVLQDSNVDINKLDAVAVSMGPGSYTGLRIGVSTAKGICYALDIPLIAIDTLQAMAMGLAELRNQPDELYCPMIDARRMEVYTAVFDHANKRLSDTEALIIDEKSFEAMRNKNKLVFFGDGADKCKKILGSHHHAIFIDQFHPSVINMSDIAEHKFVEKKFENSAYFEPFYLKDFVAAPPKVKGLY